MSFLAIYVEKRGLKFHGSLRKRDRGRQRQGFMVSKKRGMGQSWSGRQIIQHTKDRDFFLGGA